MSIQLSQFTVQNLTHESVEIRLRSLDQIQAKISRAIIHKEEINFNPGDLIKQLVRWFGFQPIQNAEHVLVLMRQLIRSPYGPKAIKQLGLQRFVKELGIVKKLLIGQQIEVTHVEQLIEELQLYNPHYQEIDDLCDIAEKLNLSDDNNTSSSSNSTSNYSNKPETKRNKIYYDKYADDDYELPWSTPTVIDYGALKSVADVLSNPSTTETEFHKALEHLQISMPDYPAEYMLQAPHIFLILKKLHEFHKDVNCPLEDIIYTCITFLKTLKESLHMRTKNVTDVLAPEAESEHKPKTQLKPEKAIQLIMKMCVEHFEANIYEFSNATDQILLLFLMCLEICEMEKLYVSASITEELIKICKTLEESYEQCEKLGLYRNQFLLLAFLLQQIAEINYISKNDVKFKLHYVQDTLVFDYALRVYFPSRYDVMKIFWLGQSFELKSKCDLLADYESEIRKAVKLIKTQQLEKPLNILEQSSNMEFTLEVFNSCKLIEMLYNAIIACLPHYLQNDTVRTQATDLLIKLLSLTDENMTEIIFKMLATAIKKHFSCLMNGENYCAGIGNNKLLAQQIIGVPLSTILLFKLIQRGFASENSQIKYHCEEIFTFLLQSQNLLGKYWTNMLDLILPIMPLLQWYPNSSKMSIIFLELLCPDAGSLPFIEVLKGNIRFLFNRDILIRSEALTRIIYILNTVNDAAQYLPNIKEISDLIPNDVCILKESRAFSRIFTGTETLNELSILQGLLQLLETPDIEPCIHKTTLIQLNVMCQNWEMSKAMCDWCAHVIPLKTLENSLRKDGYTNYTESAKPAVGILQKLLLCDANFRDELAKTENIYFLLLRALFHFNGDIQAQQDATLCLFLLTFQTFIVVTGKNVEIPKIMLNFALPIQCHYFIPESLKDCITKFMSIFNSDKQCTLYLRQFIAACFCNGSLSRINKKWLSETQKQFDFNPHLQLQENDWRLIRATNPQINFQRVLDTLSNASNHKTFVDAAAFLKNQLILYNLTTDDIQFSEENSATLIELMNKYMHVRPGNETDFVIFENMLEVSILCIQQNMTIIIESIFKKIQVDFRHPFIFLLQNVELPRRLYREISKALQHILKAVSTLKTLATDPSILYSNLFELFMGLIGENFAARDLFRVRCLLTLLQILSRNNLKMTDDQLMSYCKDILKFSSKLTFRSQTGAQCYRDCLQIVCSLYTQMKQPAQFQLGSSSIKYLSGMSGYIDSKIRALAWCCLANAQRHDQNAQLLIDLSFLPGGFPACCLSTLLDKHETIIVRELAGQLFAEVLARKFMSLDEILLLLERHSFYSECYAAVNNCVLSNALPKDDVISKRNHIAIYEIISCYCHICIELLNLDANFVKHLTEKAFMGRLYELLKKNDDKSDDQGRNVAYLRVCVDICHLYALCSEFNYSFLQRTICHDQIWLRKFCQLFGETFSSDEELQIIFQMLLAICKETQSYQHICENFAKTPQLIVNRILDALNVTKINTPLQRNSLTLLSYLLIKSQFDEEENAHITFIDVLQKPINMSNSNEQHECETKEKSTRTTMNKSSLDENLTASALRSSDELIFTKLHKLLLHVYPIKCCKFEIPPNNAKIQICDTISILLKVSGHSQNKACSLDLLDQIITIFNNFQEECRLTDTTFISRCSESKKSAIISNIQLLINVIFNWHASPTAVIRKEEHAREVTKVLHQIWPWLPHSSDLKLLILQLCQILSEHSFIICKQFSEVNSPYSQSLLQLILKIVTNETQRVKAASTEEFPNISVGLRIISNCCVCPAGRNALVKARVLDIFDYMYPFNAKGSKLKSEIVNAWLQFWELYSAHYDEGKQVRNISAICAVINDSKKYSTTRLLLLKIVRNMSFLKTNCNEFLNSKQLLYIITDVLENKTVDNGATSTEDSNYEEELIVCVTIWKLISNGIKYVAMIRGTKLAKKMNDLFDHLKTLQSEGQQLENLLYAEELLKALENIFSILNSL